MSEVRVRRYVKLKFLVDECPKGGGCDYRRCVECVLAADVGVRVGVRCQHPKAQVSSEAEREERMAVFRALAEMAHLMFRYVGRLVEEKGG